MREGLSVVIPVYNAAAWLQPTIEHIVVALREAGLKKSEAEIILVNDGSTDESSKVAHALKSEYSIKVIDQPNNGRFLARKTGVQAAAKPFILFIDSRVFLHVKSLKFVKAQMQADASKVVWNGHVVVDKKGNIIARFGDAITFIGWRRYFSNPRTCSYGLDDFDHYPKGTGCFLAPRNVILAAIEQFEKQTIDIKNSSDDTHLIRLIAAEYRINLSPSFSCTYHARTKLRQFVKHSFNRGRFFVDGFLRPGNRFFIPLVIFLFASAASCIAIVFLEPLRLPMLLAFGLGWLAELGGALLLGVGAKDSLSLFALSPLFALTYGLGIWRAVIKKLGIA